MHEVLPKAGLVYSEKSSLSEILQVNCISSYGVSKPKILPLKSITLQRIEEMESRARKIFEDGRSQTQSSSGRPTTGQRRPESRADQRPTSSAGRPSSSAGRPASSAGRPSSAAPPQVNQNTSKRNDPPPVNNFKVYKYFVSHPPPPQPNEDSPERLPFFWLTCEIKPQTTGQFLHQEGGCQIPRAGLDQLQEVLFVLLLLDLPLCRVLRLLVTSPEINSNFFPIISNCNMLYIDR